MSRFAKRVRFCVALFLAVYWSLLHIAPAAAGLVPSRTSGVTAITSQRDVREGTRPAAAGAMWRSDQ